MVAAIPAANWATVNRGTSPGRIPANVSLKHLAIVIAGFANEVDPVKQYASVIYLPTANLTWQLASKSSR